MDFLAIEYNAVKSIVSSSNLQSVDFEEGLNLAKSIMNEGNLHFSNEMKIIESRSGIYVVTPKCDKKRLLVFDLTTFSGFSRHHQESLTIIQKCARLSIKVWDKIGGYSPREKYSKDIEKFILFPINFAVENPFRVLLDRSPDSKRQHKRGTEHILVYWSGIGEYIEEPVLSNLKKAVEEFSEISCANCFSTQERTDDQLRFLSIDNIERTSKPLSPHMGMEYWRANLTESQKNFVFTDRLGPDILRGAAGTGKTLCLVLRCVNQLIIQKNLGRTHKAVLFTHSIASREVIENLVVSNGGQEFLENNSPQSLLITTLQEWCISNLAGKISATEYLDKDAMESKNTQLLYISDAYEDFLREDYETSKRFISSDLIGFLDRYDSWNIASLLQNEISVYIKGRAGEDFESYRRLERSETAIPLSTDDDFNTIFYIFTLYQNKLKALNLFDSDDITISALQETTTPIWRRRRTKDGFDVLYIDETHLFNENELGLFHNLLKGDLTNVIFTIDRTQATSDYAISSDQASKALRVTEQMNHGFATVFRSTTEIIDLASCVLASGAAIFSKMENPLLDVAGGAIANDNERCIAPYLIECHNRSDLFLSTFNEVEYISSLLKVKYSDVLIVPVNDELLLEMKEWSASNGYGCVSIDKRGDAGAVLIAEVEDKFLLGGMDYIGGLEFCAVIIVGADKDRFPPHGIKLVGTSHYALYASYNRLYVAITRAKCIVAILYEKSKELSETLQSARDHGFLTVKGRS